MNQADVIVIGAGAAGLMAAYELCKQGKQVRVLEARERPGGRIHTVQPPHFTTPVEAGAEFVHGDLPLTLSLLQEAGISRKGAWGERWRREGKKLSKLEGFIEQEDLLLKRMKELKEDLPIKDFLDRHFQGSEYEHMRRSIKRFVEGYDAADIERASTFALRQEWEGEDEHQYRPAGGYAAMINYLLNACTNRGTVFHFSSTVERVQWEKGKAAVFTDKGEQFVASQLLVTIPLALWQVEPPAKGAIYFEPQLADKLDAAKLMGMGGVIKVLFEFKTTIWTSKQVKEATGADLSGAAWIFSDEPVPTWWTQQPAQSTVLTGWLAGPKATAMVSMANEALLEQSLQSLATILSLPTEELRRELTGSQIFNWQADPFARGAYAYNTVQTEQARKTMIHPVENTLFFAGESLYEGPEMGTVEGALSSGKRAAEEMLRNQE
ncbi:MAG: FAD-dependent oxidoreductase [Williamsia sp.]|nr:FAD-dependent oxidoreductase [Williamsia sp.]